MKFPMKDFLAVKKSQIEIEIFLQLLQTFLMKQNRKFKILKIGKKKINSEAVGRRCSVKKVFLTL